MDILLWTLLAVLLITLSIWFLGKTSRRAQPSAFMSLQAGSLRAETEPNKLSSLQNDEETIYKQTERPSTPSVPTSQTKTPDAMELIDEVRKKHNTHYYFMWTWSTMSYARGILTVTYPLGWRGPSDGYSIAWFDALTAPTTRPIGAGLSWVKTQHSVSNMLQSPRLYSNLIHELKIVATNYFRRADTSHLDSKDTLFHDLGDRDVATREVISNRYYLGRIEGKKLLDDHYIHNQDITVRIYPQIPFDGTSIGEEVVSFLGEQTLCLEVIGRGLRYLIFFFDKSPTCVFHLHLIRLAEIEFNKFDACMAAYIIQNVRLNSELLHPGQLEESLLAPTLAAEWHHLASHVSAPPITLSRIDAMSGLQFEQCVAEILKGQGFEVEVTKSSGDYGIDVVAKKNGVMYGVQVKRQTDKVSRNAVSDAVAGRMYYHCDRAMVVTNSYFHDSAIVLAHSTRCQLVDRDTLREWIAESY